MLIAFLYNSSSTSPLGVKAAWALVFYPLQEGGLGIKRVKT
jgi:hypothetical protein